MPAIQDPMLQIKPVPGHSGKRQVVVSYDLLMRPEDLLEHQQVVDQATIHGRDLHDAPTNTAVLPIAVLKGEWTAAVGVVHRQLDALVDRVDLDVQQDWWRTDNGGGIEPIREFPDHLQADIELSVDGDVVARATTPLLSGSWGALGAD